MERPWMYKKVWVIHQILIYENFLGLSFACDNAWSLEFLFLHSTCYHFGFIHEVMGFGKFFSRDLKS